MRVLRVGADYPPAARGGYEQQCATTVAHLRGRGHVIRVLTAAGPPCPGDQDVHRDLVRFPVVARAVPYGRTARSHPSDAAPRAVEQILVATQ